MYQEIRDSLVKSGVSFRANDNISEHLSPDQKAALETEVEAAVQNLLNVLVIDTANDHNTNETARRVAKMFVREIWSGRYEAAPKITEFVNHSDLDQLYLTGPITVRSTCSHHLMPIMGEAWVGVLPGSNVVGLSKFNRIIDWFASRPQIQEELTSQIADYLQEKLAPKALGVVIKASHYCMKCRAVKEASGVMTTSVVRGDMRTQPSLKNEFFNLIELSKK